MTSPSRTATRLPSGLKATKGRLRITVFSMSRLPAATSQTITALSSTVTRRSLVGLNARPRMKRSLPNGSVNNVSASVASSRRTPSRLGVAVAIRLPSGDQATV